MAEIKMDVSEYEEMKKNAALANEYAQSLKESKEELKLLHEQLRAKDTERIEHLEEHAKSVVYIKKRQITETKFVRREKLEALKRLSYLASNHVRNVSSMDYFSSIDDPRNDDYVDAFFDTSTVVSYPDVEIIETKNFEDVRDEVEKKYLDAIDISVINKLDLVDRLKNVVDEKKLELKNQYNYIRLIEDQLEDQLKLEIELKKNKSDFNKRSYLITEVINELQDFNYFTAYFKLKKIKSLIEEQIKKWQK